MNSNAYINDTKQTILPCLKNFLTNADKLSKNSTSAKHNLSLCVQFITQIINDLEAGGTTFISNSENNFSDANNYNRNTLVKELQKYEKIQHDIQTKTAKKNKIERYFSTVDRRLQLAKKKTIMKSEAIIVAAMNEHDHKMLNLETDYNNILSKIETNTKNNETKKNKRMVSRNDLKTKKTQILHTYDSEMMEKYKNMNKLKSKIKMIEDSICQLQELISRQMPLYNEVIREIEAENDRIWHAKLYEIQRKIAARKIQLNFRRYLNYIKTRDIKKNKKDKHKKNQSKAKNA